MRRLTCVVCFFLLPLVAFSKEGTPQPASMPENTETIQVQTKEKKPAKALFLSLGSTLLSYGVIAGGVGVLLDGRTRGVNLGLLGLAGAVVCPTIGHIYADGGDRALLRAGYRLGFATVAMYGFLRVGNSFGNPEISVPPGITELLLGSTLVFVGFGVYDIIDAPFAVKRRIDKRIKTLQILPFITPSNSFGLSMTKRF